MVLAATDAVCKKSPARKPEHVRASGSHVRASIAPGQRKRGDPLQSPTATVEVCFMVGLMKLTNGSLREGWTISRSGADAFARPWLGRPLRWGQAGRPSAKV